MQGARCTIREPQPDTSVGRMQNSIQSASTRSACWVARHEDALPNQRHLYVVLCVGGLFNGTTTHTI